jgi:hypothetical protein
MNLFKRSRGLLAGALMAIAFAAMQPAVALAKPEPGARPRGFRLFARTLGAVVVNRVYLGLNASKGHIGVDSSGSSTIGGGYWPKGTGNQYVFNSGLQIAGKVSKPGFVWDGEVSGAFFFDPKGTTEHGEEVEPVYNSQDPADVAEWPAEATVPNELSADDQLFNPLLRGRVNGSQGDVWFLTWDGNATLTAGRPHPLGVLVESRGLAWNYPAGNEDIVYFTFTFYNVTSRNPDVYANVRPEIRDRVIALGQEFQAENEAAFGIEIPDEGFALDSLFAAFGADMDVSSDAGANYCTVNLPFAMGFCYEHTFTQKAEETYDPGIFGAPFFPGTGFVGVKYLRSPTGAGEIQLFSNTINSATGFRDPQNVFQLFRYLSGNVSAAAGDNPCNQGNQLETKVCFINPTFADARFYQSSTALSLQPGEFGSIVVAYIFAAPVAVPGFSPTASTDVRPGNVLRLVDPGLLSEGANLTDSLAGFIGFENAGGLEDQEVTQDEFQVVPGSLLAKGLIAQAVFDAGFLLPFAPESPEFYLIPGNNEVTVLWSPSRSETEGDPYFAVASTPTALDAEGNPVTNLLYDPNYRQFDVEGYRIYRGRVDNAEGLTLVAQFDYAGTVIRDYTGQINPLPTCAPELGVTDECAAEFDYVPGSGLPATVFVEYPIVGDLIQVQLGPSRAELADGTVIVLRADTAVTGLLSGQNPELNDGGVPFAYTDREVKNNFRYFYSVTAFDVNSLQSGPSSLESPRITKAVTPVPTASNVTAAELTFGVFDANGGALDTGRPFTIDPESGRFSGTPPATDQVAALFAPLVPALYPAVSLTATIDSARMLTGGLGECGAAENFLGSCMEVFVTFDQDGSESEFRTVVYAPVWSSFGEPTQADAALGEATIPADEDALARYGVPAGFTNFVASVGITQRQSIDFSAHENQAARRGLLGAAGISPGGSRWFGGTNETVDDPGIGTAVGGVGLPGVDTVWTPLSHSDTLPGNGTVQSYPNSGALQCFNYAAAIHGRQADVQITWGAGGQVTSVRDVTHNVDVPFSTVPGSSYGFVTDGNGDGRITWADFDYMDKVRQNNAYLGFCSNATPDASTALTEQPTITDASLFTGNGPDNGTLATVRRGSGFGLYINGERFIFLLTGGNPPPANSVWTLRSYSGRVRASTGSEGVNPSGYTFAPATRPSIIPGLQIQFNVATATSVAAVTNSDLDRVHTVPDPYYVTNEFEASTDNKILKFVNLPNQAIIRIYTSSGVLVRILEHNSTELGGAATWDLRNRNNQVVASGVYFYHIESGDARRVGRFTIVNFAQ